MKSHSYWRIITTREVFGGFFTSSLFDQWCTNYHLAKEVYQEKAAMLKIEEAVTADRATSNIDQAQFQKKILPILSGSVGKEMDCIVLEISIVIGVQKKGKGYIPEQNNTLKPHHFFLTKTWQRLYPDLGNGALEETSFFADLMWKAMGSLWGLVCLKQGATTISRSSFLSILEPLFEFCEDFEGIYKSNDSKMLNLRANQCKVEAKATANFLGASSERWKPKEKVSPTDVCQKRVLDFRDYYNNKVLSLPINSGLEKFIKDSYDSLAMILVQSKKLIFCENTKCKRLAVFHQRKKHCSLESDGRDCRQRVYQRKRYRRLTIVEKNTPR